MDTEIYDKAHDIMRQRREKAAAENTARINAVYAEIPEIKALNMTLFNTGSELLKTVAMGGNLEENIENMRVKNLGTQEKIRRVLAENGYPPDYLDMHYHCEKCKDMGYLNSSFCDCMKQVFGELTVEKINRNSHIALKKFDDFDLKYYSGNSLHTMTRILDFTRNYAENFSLYSENIMMSGNTGLGKTHLSLAIADRAIRKGFAVIYDSAVNIFSKIERERYSDEKPVNMLDTAIDADLLIIDDLGTEAESKFCNSMLFNIVDTRINRQKPTIISTNLTIGEIAARYNDRMGSRLSTQYTNLHFSGDDVRLQRRKEQFRR